MGRPRTSEEDRRSVNFTIRLTKSEQKRLEKAAGVCGKTPAELIRAKVFRGKFPQPRIARIELNAYLELKKIGVNINQLTRLANAGKVSPDLVKTLFQLMRGIWEINTQILTHDSYPEDR